MIPDKIKLEILTPQARIYSGEISAIRLPGAKGYFGVFPGHTPFLSTLKIGEIKVEIDNSTNYFATSGGVAEVLPTGVRVLADTAESADHIDVNRAEEARKRAEKRMEEGRKKWDLKRAQVSLTRALNRIHVAGKSS